MPLRAALFRKIHTKGETTMSLLVLQGAVEQGFIYALVALGLYISFRTLDIADLTTDGTFTLGAAVSAVFTVQASRCWAWCWHFSAAHWRGLSPRFCRRSWACSLFWRVSSP